MAQQSLKSFGHTLKGVFLSNLIYVYLFPTEGRGMSDQPVVSRANYIATKVLLGPE